MKSEQIDKLTEALAKAQGAMQSATLNKTNPHFRSKYADMAAVLEAIRQPLSDNGLAYTQTIEIRESGTVLVTRLAHTSGQWIESEFPLPSTAKIQEMGSALTYARRYSLSAIICNAADEDDDGNAAQDGGGRIENNNRPRIAPNKIAAPSMEAPMNPETGEIGPHIIQVELTEDQTGSDWIGWGSKFSMALKAAKDAAEISAWENANTAALAQMKKSAPKIHDRIVANLAAARGKLSTPELMAG